MEEEHTLNMLIDPLPFCNPMVVHHSVGTSRQNGSLGIVIREGSYSMERAGDDRHLEASQQDQMVPDLSKFTGSQIVQASVGARDKGKKKVVNSYVPYQKFIVPQIPGVGTGFNPVVFQVESFSNMHMAGPSV